MCLGELSWAGHHLSVVYSFKMSEALLLSAINDVLRNENKFEAHRGYNSGKTSRFFSRNR